MSPLHLSRHRRNSKTCAAVRPARRAPPAPSPPCRLLKEVRNTGGRAFLGHEGGHGKSLSALGTGHFSKSSKSGDFGEPGGTRTRDPMIKSQCIPPLQS